MAPRRSATSGEYGGWTGSIRVMRSSVFLIPEHPVTVSFLISKHKEERWQRDDPGPAPQSGDPQQAGR